MRKLVSIILVCAGAWLPAAWIFLQRDEWIRSTFAPRRYDPFFSLALDALPTGLLFAGMAVLLWMLVARIPRVPPSRPRGRVLLAIVIVAAAAWSLRSEGTRSHSWPMIMSDDFPSYYFAAVAVRRGLNPYDGEVIHDLARKQLTSEITQVHQRVKLPPPQRSLSRVVFPYLYPPLCAVLLMPLSALDYMQAQQIWAVLNLAAFALLLLLVWKAIADKKWALAAVLGLVVLYQPLVNNAETGQINLMVALAAWAAFHFDRKGRFLVAGVCLAVAIMLKFSPLLLLAYFASRRRWPTVSTAVITSMLILACTWVVVGTESMNYYRREVIKNYSFVTKFALPPELRPEALVLPNNVDSVKAFYDYPGVRVYNQAPTALAGMVAVARGWSGATAVRIVQILLGAMWLLTLWRSMKARRPEQWRLFAACTVLVLLTSPILWQHHLVWLFFPLLILVVDFPARRKVTISSIAAFSLALSALLLTADDFDYSPLGLSGKLTDVAAVLPYSYAQLAGTFLLWLALILPGRSLEISSSR